MSLKLKPAFGSVQTHGWWKGAYEENRTHAVVLVSVGAAEEDDVPWMYRGGWMPAHVGCFLYSHTYRVDGLTNNHFFPHHVGLR